MDLVATARKRPTLRGIVYGIGFSFTHCVVVRINMDDHGSFKHTPALQFLPSFFTESSSTPGITALVRLGYLSEPLDLLGISSSELPRAHPLNDVSLELWSHIAHDLPSAKDLAMLGSISPRAWAAANALLRFPHIKDFRIVNLRSNMPFDKPAEFEAMREGELASFSIRDDMDPYEPEEVLDEGEICFEPEWEDLGCYAEERPWALPYICHVRPEF